MIDYEKARDSKISMLTKFLQKKKEAEQAGLVVYKPLTAS